MVLYFGQSDKVMVK